MDTYKKYHEKELQENSFENLEEFTFEGIVTKCKVVDLYDGDTCTIVFYYGDKPIKTKFRMSGYDTPEVRLNKKLDNSELHKQAGLHVKSKLKERILNKILWVKFDEEEKYGRAMGKLYEIDYKYKSNPEKMGLCINDTKPSNALAKLLIWCIEQDHVKVEDLNK